MAQVSKPQARVAGAFAVVAGWIAGEMSKLRQRGRWWGTKSGRYGRVYQLDSSRVDYALARRLYDNTEDTYKLGAWAAKPVINTVVGFMGVPSFRSEDPDAQAVLDDFFGANVSLMQQTHRDALRDGDCWVWVTREEEADKGLYPETQGFRLVYNIIPPEMVSEIIREPFTGRPIEYVLKSRHEWTGESGARKTAIITQRLTAERRITQIEGDTPPGVEEGEEPNSWGFIPIVQFSNERDASAANGRSDLEPIEPFMKAYHDVMIQAIQGNKLHSTPKLKLKLKNVASFLRNNFGIDDPAEFIKKGGEISLDGHELILLEDGEDAGFAEVQSATGSAEPLLKLLFFCIVDVSETPEFAFGVHTPSSQASVTEQMPVLVRRVARKREHFTQSWQLLARMVLAMTSMSTGRRFSTHATTLVWDEIDPRSGKEVANELRNIVSALAEAVRGNLMGLESAVNFLAQYIDTMSEYVADDPEVPGERERIIRSKLIMARLEDADLALREEELIGQVLAGMGGDRT